MLTKILSIWTYIKRYGWLASLALIAGFIFSAYLWFQHDRKERKGLESQIKVMAIEIAKRDLTIATQQEERRLVEEVLLNLRVADEALRAAAMSDVARIYRETQKKMSLEKLALEKPGLIEGAINDGTIDALKCLEKMSGSKEHDEEAIRNCIVP